MPIQVTYAMNINESKPNRNILRKGEIQMKNKVQKLKGEVKDVQGEVEMLKKELLAMQTVLLAMQGELSSVQGKQASRQFTSRKNQAPKAWVKTRLLDPTN